MLVMSISTRIKQFIGNSCLIRDNSRRSHISGNNIIRGLSMRLTKPMGCTQRESNGCNGPHGVRHVDWVPIHVACKNCLTDNLDHGGLTSHGLE